VIDFERAAAWLGMPIEVEASAESGSSNVTWFVRVGREPAVLRHPPEGARLATAHDLMREHRFLAALSGQGIPVPAPIAFCESPDIAGLPFLLVERAPGICLLRDDPGDVDGVALAHSAIEILAALHAVDWRARGLSARSGSYLERQIERWKRQLDKTPTSGRLTRLSGIHDWLVSRLPPESGRTIVHGDFGFHNLLVSGNEISAVLDWELATVGDPLADLMGLLKAWGTDALSPNPANAKLCERPGAATRADLERWYTAATGRAYGENRSFYEMLALWKSIGIIEGIHSRSGGTRFKEEVPALVERALRLMDGGAEEG
jgi:aminoglycoside phosphotransferase (APT) family kinase protein